MTNWGSEVVPETYNPTTDAGLWYMPKSANCTVAAVTASLQARGYSADEIGILMSGSRDTSYSNQWVNRVGVMLGLASWRSGRPGGTPGGNGNFFVENSELLWQPYPPFRVNWSWQNYINYVADTGTELYKLSFGSTLHVFRYRYGLKTFTNFLLEYEPAYSQTNILWQTPEQPVQAVKDAVQAMVDVIVSLQSMDHVSLEVFATTARHEINLTENIQTVPDRLYQRQAGHSDSTTNTGGGLAQAITELTSARARSAAYKVIVLMSDGKPNIDENGNYVGNGAAAAMDYGRAQAQRAADLNMRIYTVSVGQDADQPFMAELATIGRGQHFHAEGTPEEYSAQLDAIFRTLGGKRPVALIE